MSDSPLSPREIRAAAAAHDELGPEYSDAVVASFLEKVDKEIDARVDARLAGMREPVPPAQASNPRTLVRGIAAVLVGGNADERLHRLLWVLLVLTVICAVGADWAGQQVSRRTAGRQRRRAAARPGHDQRMI